MRDLLFPQSSGIATNITMRPAKVTVNGHKQTLIKSLETLSTKAHIEGGVASIHRESEKAHSRQPTVAIPATNIPFYSAQSSLTPGSCCLLPVYSHTCCEDLLGGATGCCSQVAGGLVLCSPVRTARSIDYTGL